MVSVAMMPNSDTTAVHAAAVVSPVSVAMMPSSEALVAGPWVDGVPAITPALTSFVYLFWKTTGALGSVYWNTPGKLIFKTKNLSGGADAYTAETGVATFSSNMPLVGLVAGLTYELYFRLNCEPNVPGWDDTLYRPVGISWVQPSKLEPPVSGSWP